MPAKKGAHDVRTSGTNQTNAGGFSVFQLLIFLIATSSMAMNFAMLYGYIPIKGKFMNCHLSVFGYSKS